MSFTLVLLLIGALVVLLVAINVMQQHKEKIERAKKQEAAKYRAIIEDTEQVLSMASALPFSPILLRVLNRRILDALNSLATLDPKDKNVKKRRNDTQVQLDSLNEQSSGGKAPFIIPSDERKVVEAVKTLKRVKTLIKTEHSKGRMTPNEFVEENRVIDQWQLKISTTVTFERAKAAFQLEQVGSAKQLLAKLLTMLNKNPDSKDQFYATMHDRANTMLQQIDERQKANLHEIQVPEEKGDDIDELFQPKKKW